MAARLKAARYSSAASSSSVAAYVSRMSSSRSRDRVDDELVVAVELLRLVTVGVRLGLVGLLRLREQLGLVLGEEVELGSHELVEAP